MLVGVVGGEWFYLQVMFTSIVVFHATKIYIHLAFYILSDNSYTLNKYISVKLLCVSPLHYKPPGLPIEQYGFLNNQSQL